MIIHSTNTKPLLDAKHHPNDQNKQNPYSQGATLLSGERRGPEGWAACLQIPALPLACCVLVGRGLEPSGPQSPHLYDGSNHSSHLTGLPHESLSQLTRRVSNMPGPKACALGVLTLSLSSEQLQ